MRIRMFGLYVHKSIAVLAVSEALIFFGALLLGFRLRFDTWHPTAIESAKEVLWPSAAVFRPPLKDSLPSSPLATDWHTPTGPRPPRTALWTHAAVMSIVPAIKPPHRMAR